MISWSRALAVCLLSSAALAQAPEGASSASASAPRPPASAPGPLSLDRGEGRVPLLAPRDEELVYDVRLSLGWLGQPSVGKVTLRARVEPFQTDLLLTEADSSPTGLETAVLQAHAKGGYAVYEVEDTITASYLPQRWPSVVHTSVQTGSENRQREVMLGWREGEFRSRYRRDGHCRRCEQREHFVKPTWAWQDERHCKKCKLAEHRVWRAPRFRSVPEETVEMLGAVYLARSMVALGLSEMAFPLIETDELWTVKISQGARKRHKVPAGTFDTVKVELTTEVPPGEESEERGSKFSGLFGIHGTIAIWIHPESGVPVTIRGDVPIGPIDLDLEIELESYRGTPAGFRPVP